MSDKRDVHLGGQPRLAPLIADHRTMRNGVGRCGVLLTRRSLSALRNGVLILQFIGIMLGGTAHDLLSQGRIRYLSDTAVVDLNTDGRLDTVFVVQENFGGSGVFVRIDALISTPSGYALRTGPALGDRVSVDSMRVSGGIVRVYYLTRGPDDPFCCPTVPTSASVDNAVFETPATAPAPESPSSSQSWLLAVVVGLALLAVGLRWVSLRRAIPETQASFRQAREPDATPAHPSHGQFDVVFEVQPDSHAHLRNTLHSPSHPVPPAEREKSPSESFWTDWRACPWCAKNLLPSAKTCMYCQRETEFSDPKGDPAPASEHVVNFGALRSAPPRTDFAGPFASMPSLSTRPAIFIGILIATIVVLFVLLGPFWSRDAQLRKECEEAHINRTWTKPSKAIVDLCVSMLK